MTDEFEGLSLVELIELLEPVPEPEPISMIPQTEGWVWLGLVVLIVVAWLTKRAVQHYKANAYRRAALSELSTAGDDPARISSVLRRAALEGFPRVDIASLTGTDWLEFLDGSFPGSGFCTGPGATLSVAPYSKTHDPAPGLNALAKTWIRKHSAKAAS